MTPKYNDNAVTGNKSLWDQSVYISFGEDKSLVTTVGRVGALQCWETWECTVSLEGKDYCSQVYGKQFVHEANYKVFQFSMLNRELFIYWYQILQKGLTPIMLALCERKLFTAKCLIACGASMHACDE